MKLKRRSNESCNENFVTRDIISTEWPVTINDTDLSSTNNPIYPSYQIKVVFPLVYKNVTFLGIRSTA